MHAHCEMLLQESSDHQEEEAVADHDHSDEDTNDEHCPPGCACYCCTAVMIAPLATVEMEKPMINQQLAVFEGNLPLVDVSDRIWQPPRYTAS